MIQLISVIKMQTVLINVENILTDYVMLSIDFWQKKAEEIDKPLPDDFLESLLGAGIEQTEKTFFRFPHFQQFELESTLLFEKINNQVCDDNPMIDRILQLKSMHDLRIGLIYDQRRSTVNSISDYLQQRLEPFVQLYRDDAFLGKPEANIFNKARALGKLKANDTWVLDASKNGILSAFLANMKGVYLDQGLGLSERIYKYSYRNIQDIDRFERLLIKRG